VDVDGRTALHLASKAGHAEAARLILAAAGAADASELPPLEDASATWAAAAASDPAVSVGSDSSGALAVARAPATPPRNVSSPVPPLTGDSAEAAATAAAAPNGYLDAPLGGKFPFEAAGEAKAELEKGPSERKIARLKAGRRRLVATSTVCDLLDCRGNTALHLAKSADLVSLLAASGAMPSLANQSGASPLHAAVRRGDPAVVAALVACGASAGPGRGAPAGGPGRHCTSPCVHPRRAS